MRRLRRPPPVVVGLLAACLGVMVLATPAAAQTRDGETRLFLGPTARPLPSGEGYFVLHGGLVPAFQVGITDRVSIGAGTFFLADGNVWLTPKVQLLRQGATGVSATVVHVMVPGSGALGFAFGSLTREARAGGITLGVGVAYAHGWDDDDDWASGGPLVMIGGDRRLSPRLTFLSENYLIAGDAAVLVNGVRAAWGRFALDVGAVILVGDGVFGSPILNLAWRF